MLVQEIHQLQQLFAGLIIHGDRVLWLPDQRDLAGLAELGFQRLRHFAVTFRRRIDFVAAFAGGNIVGAGLDRSIEHRIIGSHTGVVFDHAGTVEHESDRAGFTKIAAGLGEIGADVGCGAVAIVGQRLDDDGDAARTVALIADLVVIIALAADRLLDGALDIVLGHVLLPRSHYRGAQPWIHRRVRSPELGSDGDFARQLAEQLRLLSVLPPLAVHDVLELGMAGHARSLGIRPEKEGGKRGVISRKPGKIKDLPRLLVCQ